MSRARTAAAPAPRGRLRRVAAVVGRRLPVPTVRRRIVLAFVALVAVAIALVGGISFSVTAATFDSEMDSALESAAATTAAGGVVPITVDHEVPSSGPDRARDADDPIISLIQHIAADGTVTPIKGVVAALPVDTQQLVLASSAQGGAGRFDARHTAGTTFRVYTLALGDGRGAVVVGRDVAYASHVLTHLALTTAFIGLGVVVLAALLGWWVALQITRRLAALTDAAEKVSRTGDLAVPIESGGGDEVSRLATSMRTMLAELGASRASQRRLVEDAGHELRTPITSLRTNARVMRRYDEIDAADRERLLDDVDGELEELTALVNELVELATDGYAAEPARLTALAEPVSAVADRVRRRSGREIVVTADDSALVVQRGAIERAVGNLLENAVKFDAHGAAPIEVDVRGGVIRVSDRGPGVLDEELDAIFDRFHRSEASRSLPGSGLGLAIVRDVAARHGGTARAVARPGGGLVVTLVLGDHVCQESEGMAP